MKEKDIHIRSMVGARTGDPAVSFKFGDQHANLSLADARKVALDLLGAADAAESDAALVRYLRGVGMDDSMLATMLAGVREARG